MADLDQVARQQISKRAAALVRGVRAEARHSLMESFLSEYGLSTTEGVGLMCLAEALLRVPDPETIDDLIRDKIEPSDWGAHLGKSSSSLINASTWALLLTGRLLDDDAENQPAGALRGLIRRLGEPVVRVAVAQAMKALGQQFVLGQTIGDAVKRGLPMLARGYTYSYDMLGEAARTAADAARYQHSYANALKTLGAGCGTDIRTNPGISVKLSALHPRYEVGQRERVMSELVPRVLQLARLARGGNMGFTLDAEEADRLDLSLDVIEAVLSAPDLAGWDGFGVVVQAYGKRAAEVLDWLHALAGRLDRRIMVRLVKGAYWDSEIKHAQELGIAGFPVFTRKAHTDVSYLACARKLLQMTDRIYPQFATHNAHTCAAVLVMAGDRRDFEFQRLHGMGEALHRIVLGQSGTHCRIYAPVGAHRDLLAYLVRRLLENGANSSFVNQIADEQISPEVVARDPFEVLAAHEFTPNPAITAPPALFEPVRRNARGWNLNDPQDIAEIEQRRAAFRDHQWQAAPMVAQASNAVPTLPQAPAIEVRNPASPADAVGRVTAASEAQVLAALAASDEGFYDWSARAVESRAETLRRAAILYERHAAELFALCTREAGKTLRDGIAEVREAVDFLRYYASQAERLAAGNAAGCRGRGVFVCISPWNFPLAIFTGQIGAALAAGNAVIAKPAEQTPLIAARAVELLHEAGVPRAALQLLPGDGAVVGAALTRSAAIAGVLFTGSIEVAQSINRSLAEHASPDAVLVAETGGLNAMIVDSTALPEQAVRDILASAFQSAGQRCSALRILYIQRDVGQRILDMLCGAMDELAVGDPWSLATDIGPVIDEEAVRAMERYCNRMADAGRLIKKLRVPQPGRFVAPQVFKVAGIQDLQREIFGPVLHVASFEAEALDEVVDAINSRGYGLTFGLHTRIDDRVQRVVDRIRVGNIYVNRNQIGAVVGSQPFGGEGLSGTGPKAGGPHYLPRLMRWKDQAADRPATPSRAASSSALSVSGFAATIIARLKRLDRTGRVAGTDRIDVLRRLLADQLGAQAQALFAVLSPFAGNPLAMPGPTGESNQLRLAPRDAALCLGPGWQSALVQATQALAAGGAAIMIADAPSGQLAAGQLQAWQAAGLAIDIVDVALMPDDPAWLVEVSGFGLVAYAGPVEHASAIRQALARRDGDIKPLVTELLAPGRYVLERLLCVDTTAAGGNASLLAASEASAA